MALQNETNVQGLHWRLEQTLDGDSKRGSYMETLEEKGWTSGWIDFFITHSQLVQDRAIE